MYITLIIYTESENYKGEYLMGEVCGNLTGPSGQEQQQMQW